MIENNTDGIDKLYPIGFTFLYIITAFILQILSLFIAGAIVLYFIDIKTRL